MYPTHFPSDMEADGLILSSGRSGIAGWGARFCRDLCVEFFCAVRFCWLAKGAWMAE